MRFSVVLFSVSIIFTCFACCDKKQQTVTPLTDAATDSSKIAASVVQVPSTAAPTTDTFYGRWTQETPMYDPSFSVPAGYGTLYIQYDKPGTIVIYSNSIGNAKVLMTTGVCNTNDSGKYVSVMKYRDGFNNYQFTVTKDSVTCTYDQSDGVCGGNDYPGSYVGHKMNHPHR